MKLQTYLLLLMCSFYGIIQAQENSFIVKPIVIKKHITAPIDVPLYDLNLFKYPISSKYLKAPITNIPLNPPPVIKSCSNFGRQNSEGLLK